MHDNFRRIIADYSVRALYSAETINTEHILPMLRRGHAEVNELASRFETFLNALGSLAKSLSKYSSGESPRAFMSVADVTPVNDLSQTIINIVDIFYGISQNGETSFTPTHSSPEQKKEIDKYNFKQDLDWLFWSVGDDDELTRAAKSALQKFLITLGSLSKKYTYKPAASQASFSGNDDTTRVIRR